MRYPQSIGKTYPRSLLFAPRRAVWVARSYVQVTQRILARRFVSWHAAWR